METKFITENDKNALNSFFAHLFTRFNVQPDKTLYHYTTGQNLIEIISSNEVWATHISCLNDSKEMQYSIDELRKRISARLAANESPALRPLLTRLEDLLSSPGIEAAPIFVSCFSEKKDDLSQWRAYGGGEGGYSIGFDSKLLREHTIAAKANPMLLRVEYDEQTHKVLFDDIIKWAESFYLAWEGRSRSPNEHDWTVEFVDFYLWNLSFLSACIKHPAFIGEAEWRLVYRFGPNDVKKMKFRQKPSMLSRHIPINLGAPLPISHILLGPCRYPDLSRIGAADLLLANDFDAEKIVIEPSQVPFRG